MPKKDHQYHATLEWQDEAGSGTQRYDGYSRSFQARLPGKPTLEGSADPAFHGDCARHNPEDMLLVAVASCHMLSFLALCARGQVDVRSYVDNAAGSMTMQADGGGRFTSIVLNPRVRLANATQQMLAAELHGEAHRLCFIANSCNFPIKVQPEFDEIGAGAMGGAT